MNNIGKIPYNWEPRSWQRTAFAEVQRGKKKVLIAAARRSGKDVFCANLIIWLALTQRVGEYHLVAPYRQQASKIWMSGLDEAGHPFFLQYLPEQCIKEINISDLRITLINGSVIRFIGSDSLNALPGLAVVGVAFTEYARSNPLAWTQIYSACIRSTKGWAIFNSSPLGTGNHFYQLYQNALKDPDEWHVQYLTNVRKDAPSEDGSEIFSDQDIEKSIAEGADPAIVRQEFRASWAGSAVGCYYSDQIAAARENGQVSIVPWDTKAGVYTTWDLGLRDDTAIGFFQRGSGGWLHCIEAISGSGKSLQYWIKEVLSRPYKYSGHYAPHDIKTREYSTGRSRWSMARDLGLEFRIVPDVPLQDGIQSVRALFPIMRFDVDKCANLLDALASYSRSYDPARNVFNATPTHTWASHYSDMFRYAALVADEMQTHQRIKLVECSGIDPIDPTGVGLGLTQQDLEDLSDQWRGRRNDAPRYIDERSFDRPYIGYGEHLSQTRRYEEEE